VAHASAGRVWPVVGLAAAGVLLVVIGADRWQAPAPPDGAEKAAASAPATTPAATAPAAASSTQPALERPLPGTPRALRIPALGVSAPVVPVRAVDDTLVPPSDPDMLGWWADGARPGAARGSALVTGHSVHTGGGALNGLSELPLGARVVVVTRHSRIVYEVQRVRTYSKGRISRDAERLFSQESPGRLVLVTCADWDGSRYLSNTVAIARGASP
jgi:sortase (surface protein transpeptidase)